MPFMSLEQSKSITGTEKASNESGKLNTQENSTSLTHMPCDDSTFEPCQFKSDVQWSLTL